MATTTAPAPFTVLIPSRMASSRLPNKPLADIGGTPMVVRVAQRAPQSLAQRVVVAGDDAMQLHAHALALADDPALRDAMGRSGRALALRMFSPESAARDVVAALHPP